MSRVKELMRHYPTISQAVQTSVIMASGDFIAQKFVEKKEELDKRRLLTFGGIGLFFVGPIVSHWYRFLDCAVPCHWSPVYRGVTKMFFDQALAAPIMLASVMSLLEVTLKTPTWEAVKENLKEKYPTVLLNNYKVWPAVQMINFTVVPLHMQVAVNQLCGVAWNTYLSTATQHESKP